MLHSGHKLMNFFKQRLIRTDESDQPCKTHLKELPDFKEALLSRTIVVFDGVPLFFRFFHLLGDTSAP